MMIETNAAPRTESLSAAARRLHLRAAMRPKIVGPEVLELLRQERAECRRNAPTIIGGADEEAATS